MLNNQMLTHTNADAEKVINNISLHADKLYTWVLLPYLYVIHHKSEVEKK